MRRLREGRRGDARRVARGEGGVRLEGGGWIGREGRGVGAGCRRRRRRQHVRWRRGLERGNEVGHYRAGSAALLAPSWFHGAAAAAAAVAVPSAAASWWSPPRDFRRFGSESSPACPTVEGAVGRTAREEELRVSIGWRGKRQCEGALRFSLTCYCSSAGEKQTSGTLLLSSDDASLVEGGGGEGLGDGIWWCHVWWLRRRWQAAARVRVRILVRALDAAKLCARAYLPDVDTESPSDLPNRHHVLLNFSVLTKLKVPAV